MAQTTYLARMPVAFAGMKADSGEDDCVTRANAEASAEIPFGVAVCRQTTSDTKVILPAASGDIANLAGVVVHSHEYAPNVEIGTTGVKPKVPMAVMQRGRIWVTVEEAVAVGDRAFVRFATGAGGSQKGAFRKSADTATAAECKGMVYRSAASASGLAILEIDMPAWRAVQ